MSDFAWLIEAPGPMYLRVQELGHRYEFCWTDDPNAALRFFNREQAGLSMMAIREALPKLFAFAVNLRDPRPIQHGFLGETPDV